MDKLFIKSDSLLKDSFQLAWNIYQSGFKVMFFVNSDSTTASLGKKSLYLGNNRTSSKVNAFDFSLSILDYNQELIFLKALI